jgi:hypothetical protein
MDHKQASTREDRRARQRNAPSSARPSSGETRALEALQPACINGGGNHPKAVNKTSFSASSVIPVQNGKADYTISVTATFSPSCSPPMTVQFTSATLTDTTNNLSVKLI